VVYLPQGWEDRYRMLPAIWKAEEEDRRKKWRLDVTEYVDLFRLAEDRWLL
jgi:hypothetical protein